MKEQHFTTTPRWQELTRAGMVYQGSVNGEVLAIKVTESHLSEMIVNFNDETISDQQPVWRDHTTSPGEEPVGYILDLKLDKSTKFDKMSLWALIEFSPDIYPTILNGKAPYLSIEFYPNAMHTEEGDGEVGRDVGMFCCGAALTPTPQKSGMQKLQLSSKTSSLPLWGEGLVINTEGLRASIKNSYEKTLTKRYLSTTARTEKQMSEKVELQEGEQEEVEGEAEVTEAGPLLVLFRDALGVPELDEEQLVALLEPVVEQVAELLQVDVDLQPVEEKQQIANKPESNEGTAKLEQKMGELISLLGSQKEEIAKLKLQFEKADAGKEKVSTGKSTKDTKELSPYMKKFFAKSKNVTETRTRVFGRKV